MNSSEVLISGFLRSVREFPERPALEIRGASHSYAELFRDARSLAATLQAQVPKPRPPLTAIYGHRSKCAFAALLAASLRGDAYLPLNPAFPAKRLSQLLLRTRCPAMVADASAEAGLPALLEAAERPLVLLLPEREEVTPWRRRFPRHRFLGARDLASAGEWQPPTIDPDSAAYVMFTSGSTGVPKGVMVSHRSVRRFIEFVTECYAIRETDRFSQLFALAFDLSIFDTFVAWERGACVCVPDERSALVPDRYVRESRLTIWFSVPSLALLLKRLGKLESGAFPSLRLSLFCGEALTADLADAWSKATPDSAVENLYGPTELTLACTRYRWDPDSSPNECLAGVVPIGMPFPGMRALIVDDQLREVAPGETGELLMAGPQLALGYWEDGKSSAAAFRTPPGRTETYYRTGDLVRRPEGDGPLCYRGRPDHQIRVRGHRVELGEIEAVFRGLAKANAVVAVGWPVTPSGADGIAVFVEASTASVDGLRKRAAEYLPAYMVPRIIRLVPEFPLSANGKIDRRVLARSL